MKAQLQIVDLSRQEIEQALAASQAALPAAVFRVVETVLRGYLTLVEALDRKNASIRRLRRMLFGPSTEKCASRAPAAAASTAENAAGAAAKPDARGGARPGHGRNGQDAFAAATHECVPHDRLKTGDRCPGCHKGKVYEQAERPGILVRVRGQAPLTATVYELQKLRCNLCGEIFEAKPPAGVGREKYDETAGAMVGLLKYGGGFPFNRLQRLQQNLGIPLPPATQWEIVRDAAPKLEPVHQELVRAAAAGKVLHNDDTGMRILAWMGKRREGTLKKSAAEPPDEGGVTPERTGIFTSGIVSQTGGRRIALFFTGRRHAGENLQAVLSHRARGQAAPIQMCDGLARNVPKEMKTILANCLAHGRRKVVEVVENFPEECGHILRVLSRVYRHDAIARRRGMTQTERLRYHQDRSGPVLEELRVWMETQRAEKQVEPNSGLGEAIRYLLERWEKLTLFLRRAGAPLDNNVCERALKKAIQHRKNALFYKTDKGAHVGDVFMTLIHTCELSGVGAFDYLTELLRHAAEVLKSPSDWLPWNYRRGKSRAPPR